MSDQPDSDEAQATYYQLREQAGESLHKCQFLSAFRIYGEMRRHCRDRGIAEGYLLGTFHQMDTAQNVLDFRTMSDRAVELIALLESDERLLRIQGDFPRAHYEYFVGNMSTCAYENLAEATGQLEGFNSDGLHACIADGLSVCRQTGKLRCVNCFREYACDVYLAADDPEIASHQCRLVVDHKGPWTDRGDRRWLALGKLAWVQLLNGRTDDAVDMIDEALRLTDAEGVSLKLESRIRTLLLRDCIRIAHGLPPELESDAIAAELPTNEEYPGLHMARDWNSALLATREGHFEQARDLLQLWDQRLTQSGATHNWFENRIRLVALYQRNGDQTRADALGKPLEKKAIAAGDFLTLRRLRSILDSNTPSPLGIPVTDNQVPANTTGADTTPPDTTPLIPEATTPSDRARNPATMSLLRTFADRLQESVTEPETHSVADILGDMLAVDPAQFAHPDDVASLFHLCGFAIEGAENGQQIWAWANSLAAPHRDDPGVLSELATLGDTLRDSPTAGMSETITPERTEPLFRRSLELDQSRPGNYMRAGDHYASLDRLGDAERCYARAFRLARHEGFFARRLATLYVHTDRPRDALHVLDVCIREGTTDPQVAHDAAHQAYSLEQWNAALRYFDHFEQQAGQQPWNNFYRAICHYELGSYPAALAAAEAEIDSLAQQGSGDAQAADAPWYLRLVVGLCQAQAGDHDGAANHFEHALVAPLFEPPHLSLQGMSAQFQRLHAAIRDLSKNSELLSRVEARQLRAGLMAESWFDSLRSMSTEPLADELYLFECLIEQPLGTDWDTNPDRLPHQAGWTTCHAEWGVLATSEEDALARALAMQSRCHPLPPRPLQATRAGGPFEDTPGIAWQGFRYPADQPRIDDAMPN